MPSLLRTCALFFSLASLTASARAQDLNPPLERQGEPPPERVFGKHIVQTPAFFPTPFLSTHFSFRQGITQVFVPDFPVTQTTNVDADLLGIDERIEGGLKFAKIFEASLFVDGEVISGINGKSVIVAGSSFSYGGGLAGRVRIFRSEDSGTEISARVEGSSGKGGSIELLRLANVLVQNRSLGLDAIAQANVGRLILGNTTRHKVLGQVLAAQTLGPNFDLQGSLGVGYSFTQYQLYNPDQNRELDQDLKSVDPQFGIALGANLNPAAPIGFVLEYEATSRRQVLPGVVEAEWTSPSHLIGLGINAIHPNFQVGLTIARLMETERVRRISPGGADLTSGKPAVNYAVLQFELDW